MINVLGLALGMATTLLILEYVVQEMSYDRFHENKEDLYRVIIRQEKEGVIAVPVAWLTIYFQVRRLAATNPSDVLKFE